MNISVETTRAADICAQAVKSGGKILICGNGGSAAMAGHFAAELMVKLGRIRPPIPCINLCADQALITACANDFGYAHIFVRQIEALASSKDVLIVLSTSGRSDNVLRAISEVCFRGICVLGPSTMRPGETTSGCQERHLVWLHDLAKRIEDLLYPIISVKEATK